MNLSRSRIEELVSLGYIHKRKKGDLSLYNYTPKTQYENFWCEETLECRGLILSDDNRIVARPMRKFFNWGEGGRTTNAPIRYVWEKLDGSLGICYRWRDEWHVATRGSFDSEQAQWATEWVRNHPVMRKYTGAFTDTLLFEIIYPGNRVVVDYGDRAECVLIGQRSNQTGQDLTPILFRQASSGFTLPRHYDIQDPAELVALCQGLDENSEGFVAEFADGQRFKFKGEKYKELHRLISGLSYKYAVEVVQSGTVEQARGALPDEFLIEFDNWVSDIQSKVRSICAEVETRFEAAPKGDRKIFALWAKEHCPDIMPYLFAKLDGRDYLPMLYRREFS